MPDQMPVTPVLILLVLYITFGKSILKINFKSQVCSSYWRVKINPMQFNQSEGNQSEGMILKFEFIFTYQYKEGT